MSRPLARRAAALAAAAVTALAGAPAARAATAPSGTAGGGSGALWATVDICDTAKHPDDVGVRASMPGTPRGTARRMRFRLQYRDGARWRYVQGADSGWRRLSRARGLPVELGWTFGVTPQAARVAFRGVVRFRWLRDGAVVLHRLRTTEAGHHATVGADPDGYSAATCSIG